MKILITDDERIIAEDLARDAAKLCPDACIDMATSAEDALALSAEKDYDIALIDIDMPGMDGMTFARKLSKAQPAVNIIFVTGHQEFAVEAHEMYCSAFLLKPVGTRKLKKAFENLRKPFIDMPSEFYSEHYSGGDVIGKRIELFREQRGITRQDLAECMGVTRQTVFRWESGARIPDILTFIRLARYLGVEINDIIRRPE